MFHSSSRFFIALCLLGFAAGAQAAPVLSGGCATTDFTTSSQCVGVYDPGNDNGVHSIFGDAAFQAVFGTGWTLLTKAEDPSWSTPTWLMISGEGTTSGTWMVGSFQGYTEVMGVLKAGGRAAAYDIDETVLSGTWDVTSDAWEKDKNGKPSDLSHFSFWVKDDNRVPEPSIVALMALGLLGLGLTARRKG